MTWLIQIVLIHHQLRHSGSCLMQATRCGMKGLSRRIFLMSHLPEGATKLPWSHSKFRGFQLNRLEVTQTPESGVHTRNGNVYGS